MKLIWRASIALQAIIMALSAQAQNYTATQFNVGGACGMCKARIEKAAKNNGVQSASWSTTTKTISVFYDSSTTTLKQIHQSIADAGHDTDLEKAKDEVYDALPECCHYRDANNPHRPTDAETVYGIVVSEDSKGNFSPLHSAGIQWLATAKRTTTDEHGVFSIAREPSVNQLIVSYSGLISDTINVAELNHIQIVLAADGELKEVKVASSQRLSSYISTNDAFRANTITAKELLKAACCNLSESFETNPSVDVSYSDAVTGSKQIQMLGLAGIYTQLTVENLPGPRGLATVQGLSLIPGPWIESIQLSKGTGSVVNGFESIAGQINVELIKSDYPEKLYFNGYLNAMGRMDINLNLTQKINDKWSTALLLHDDFLQKNVDFNQDGFKDLPTGNQFTIVNRWLYQNNKGLTAQFSVKAIRDQKHGGETDFSHTDKFTTSKYGVGINTSRYEAFAKLGYIFPNKKYKSIGLQLSGYRHTQDAFFGLTEYNARQENLYGNLIYQSIIRNTNHKFRTGISFNADRYNEFFKEIHFKRNETVPGAFFEYTFTHSSKLNVVAGLRGDYNNLYGFFATPRLNVRYEPVTGTTFRMSFGRGQRTANILAENMAQMVSSREFIFAANRSKAYGPDPEVAWNKGLSIDQKFKLFGRNSMISFDFFRNDFTHQVIVDLEDPRELQFYNLRGKSYSNSFQAEVSLTPLSGFDVRLAYRYFDVKSTYNSGLLEKPFTAGHRAFANLAYAVNGWHFDYTVNYVGKKRIPSTMQNPAEYRMDTYSPNYVTMNAQVSKLLGKNKQWELYAGVENLSNFIQRNAIIAGGEPFGPYFDASMIWGPIIEKMFYGGFRFKIK